MAQATSEETIDRAQLHELAQQLRVDSVRSAAAAGSGHPTSSMSAADLMAVLFARYLRYDFDAPENTANDHLVFSKGHASPLLYSALQAGRGDRGRGAADLPRVRLAPAGPPDAGDPLGRRRDRLARPGPADLGRDRARRQAARSRRLQGLGALRRLRARRGLDVGGLRARRLRRPRQPDRDRRRQPARPARPDDARVGHLFAGGARRAPAAGTCRRSTGTTSRRSTPPTRGRSPPTRPAAIFARTKKGSGVAAVEDQPNQHGKPLADPEAAVEELGGDPLACGSRCRRRPRRSRSRSRPPRSSGPPTRSARRSRRAAPTATPSPGSARSTRASSRSTARSATRPTPSASPPSTPTASSRCTSPSSRWSPPRVGLQTRGWKPFASSFGAFLSRAYDFVRMAAISDADLKLCGSHVGVSIGPDGPSQMALEDIASLRAVLGSVVLYPSDANQAVAAARRDARAPRHQLHAHDPRGDPGALRGRTRTSRSAAAAWFAPATTTTSP